MLRGSRAFTLIELMICIAILAILIAIPKTALDGIHRLSREDNYRHALANARYQLEQLREEPFSALPPQTLKVGGHGQVKISRQFLVEDSVKVYHQGEELTATRLGPGIYQVDPALEGKSVVANYSFDLPDKGEPQVVDKQGNVRLRNRPVRQVVNVYAAAGDKLNRLSGWKLEDGQSGRLAVGSQYAGKTVVVDYLGSDIRNSVHSTFLDEQLLPSLVPTDAKMLRLSEHYSGTLRMELELLKVRQ